MSDSSSSSSLSLGSSSFLLRAGGSLPGSPLRSDHAARIHRVVEHIDRNLDQALTLPGIAAVANFSPYHFHRIFAAWMGETLGDYIRRRRVETGALRLVSQPRTTVLAVALSVGFGSAESFTRAFRSRFGSSPSAWRRAARAARGRESNPGQTERKHDQEVRADAGYSRTVPQREALMNVKLMDRAPVHVAYLTYVGEFGEPVSRFWQERAYPWMLTNNLVGRPRYGVSHDDPTITASDKTRYDAAVEVERAFSGTGDYHESDLPGGRFACVAFEGTATDISEAWARLLRDWLPDSGLQLDARPFYEYYATTDRFDSRTGVFTCTLCIPVTGR